MGGSGTSRAMLVVLLARFVRARWGYRFRNRAHFEAWQRRRLRAFLRRARRAPFYAGLRPRDYPVTDKSTLLEHFDALSTRGVLFADALAAGLAAERSRDFAPTVAGDLTVGLSSGTSGRRGVFLVSPRERMLWAGTVLARVLDSRAVGRLLRPWTPPLTIAFFLRSGGNLYESVASSRVRFRFFDLTRPLDEHVEALARSGDAAGGVDVLVAPASVLAALAGRADELPCPRLVVSVAEVLDPDAEALIERAWGVMPRQVYQATEGLLALPCESGALHLNEESVRIDREWLDAERTRFVPIVTDFDRRTQIIARHRLDDVLRIDPDAPERCSCGRVTTRLAAIDGRADAVLRLPSTDGTTTVEVFPDAVRRVMAVESEGFSDWRIRQRGVTVHVELADPAPGARACVERALTSLLETWGCRASLVHDDWTPPDPEVKRRRIVRESP